VAHPSEEAAVMGDEKEEELKKAIESDEGAANLAKFMAEHEIDEISPEARKVIEARFPHLLRKLPRKVIPFKPRKK
jgi:hypothetical protein